MKSFILEKYIKLREKLGVTDYSEDLIRVISGSLYYSITKKNPKLFHIYQDNFYGGLENFKEDYDEPSYDVIYYASELYNKLILSQEFIIDLEIDSTTILMVMIDSIIILNRHIYRKTNSGKIGETGSHNLKIYCSDESVVEKYRTLIDWKTEKYVAGNFKYLTSSCAGLKETSLSLGEINIDLEKNYNQDLPYQGIVNFLVDSRNPGLIILHGKPGTGKTTLIKHLICSLQGKTFVMMPTEILMTSGKDSFIQYFLTKGKDKIFVLEDCECLMVKRERGIDLSTLLNLTDGILGNALRTKFICTFNTDLENIDPALLRKGRLKVKYEFKELSLEKTKTILPRATKEMTLAEIYNTEDNGWQGDTGRKKIGY